MRTIRRMSILMAAPAGVLACLVVLGKPAILADKEQGDRLWDVCRSLQSEEFVDLTHAFAPDSPHWKGFSPMRVKDVYSYDRDGFWAQEFTHVGQWGTHVDPPAHFHKGLRTVDQIEPKEMVLPLAVIDVHEKAEQDPDYVLQMEDVRGWETKHGPIPTGSFVAMRTDWAKRWPDDAKLHNRDDKGLAHYPGWSVTVLKYLYEERHITASGHETTDTDPGKSTDKGNYACENYVLGTNHYQIELMDNLDKVPESGAILICTFPKPKDGSGFPARLIAVVPAEK